MFDEEVHVIPGGEVVIAFPMEYVYSLTPKGRAEAERLVAQQARELAQQHRNQEINGDPSTSL